MMSEQSFAEKIVRFKFDTDSGMLARPDGEWVRYEDHKTALSDQRIKEISDWQKIKYDATWAADSILGGLYELNALNFTSIEKSRQVDEAIKLHVSNVFTIAYRRWVQSFTLPVDDAASFDEQAASTAGNIYTADWTVEIPVRARAKVDFIEGARWMYEKLRGRK